jgi:NosR/NirI family transcriptional regulator, nitrous oxide reductase regulator
MTGIIGRKTKVAIGACMLVLAASLGGSRVHALGDEPKPGESVTQYLTPTILQAIFPGADKVGEVAGAPPAGPVYQDGRQIGYLFSTWDVTQSKGFSNRPVVLLVGIDLAGHIAGARLVHHTEPIGILGLKDEAFHRFVESYKGHDLNEGIDVVSELSASVLGAGSFSQRAGPHTGQSVKLDAVSRATTSSVLISDAIIRGARIVARSRGILATAKAARAHLDVDRFAPATWPELEASGAIGHLHLSYGDIRAKLPGKGAAKIGDPTAGPSDAFLDFYIALVSPAAIGINLLGDTWFGQYTAGHGIDDELILVAANAPYSVLGQDWEHADTLAAIQFVQGDKTIRLSGRQIKTLPFLHAKQAPTLSERALVFLPGEGGLDPTQPWEVRLLVGGEGPGKEQNFANFNLNYRVPDNLIVTAPSAPADVGRQTSGQVAAAPGGHSATEPDQALAWPAIWSAHRVRITILALGLTVLTVILFGQDYLSRRRRLHRVVRVGFLIWTLVWLGWYAGAQLTVVNLITDIHTVVTNFRWDFFLADPLVAIVSLFTVTGLFLWGRAMFCGWLCPFGALQELANNIARQLGIPQLAIPLALHERLVAIKYLIFLGLVATSFVSWDLAMTGAEIEPFKAAIILRFMTAWPLVAYAALLLIAGLFIERVYCRFACPLGGGLAILGRVRMFAWLKRHPECGTRCRTCESVCPVGAIQRNGQINMNECFYCLDCQVTYYDDHVCPPMVWRRKGRRSASLTDPASAADRSAVQEVSP